MSEIDTNDLRLQMTKLIDGAREASENAQEAADAAHRDIMAIFSKMEDRIHELESEMEERGEADERDATEAQEIGDAVERFLDCVDRPVGTRDFSIPKSSESQRAIIGLYDAVGRNM